MILFSVPDGPGSMLTPIGLNVPSRTPAARGIWRG